MASPTVCNTLSGTDALPSTVWQLVADRAARMPEAPILQDEADRRLTFAALRDAAETCAAGLAERGFAPGTRVSWQLPTGLEAAVLMLALARLGAVQNPIIPILREREVRFMTAQTRAEWLVVPSARSVREGALDPRVLADVGFSLLALDEFDRVGGSGLQLPAGDVAALPPAPEDDHGIRWIYYTSGSTADPKGARHTDASILAASNAFTASGWFGPDELAVVPIPIAHIGGIMFLEVMLRTGCRAALVATFDPVRTPRYAAEVGGTILLGTVAVFHAYLAAQRAHGPRPLFPRLRVAANGGAPRPIAIHAELRETLGGAGTMSGWGLTECPAATAGCVGDGDDALARSEGRPGPGVELSVVDATGRDCPPGVEGELRLRAPQLFRGYVDASLDAEAFDAQGRFRTGDLGVQEPAGHVRVTGRLKDIVIRNGENISALEVEQALASHPGIQDVAVIGLPDIRTGERCCAVLQTPPGGAAPSLRELAEHCLALGVAKQKIPEQIEEIDSLPRSELGKIDKRALRLRFTRASHP